MKTRDFSLVSILAVLQIDRWLPLVWLLIATGCGGGSGGEAPPQRIVDSCDSESVLEDGVCRQFTQRIDTRAETPFVEDGQPVELEVVLFSPLEGSRFPTVVIHHGSTGDGSDPSRFGDTFTSKPITKFFVDRGFMVAFPQRRGRGMSDGLYDEGFRPDRSSYSCDAELTLAGAERALEDLDAITDWVRNRADVDTTRMFVAGTSRGGILSIAHVARRLDVYLGAINFVGGWLSEGCGDHLTVNRTLFREGAGFPGTSIWLYGTNDSFYSIAYSRANFDAFAMAGGMGEFHEFTRASGLNGHFLVNSPELWGGVLDDYVNSR